MFSFISLSFLLLSFQNLEFFREDITFEIKNGNFYIDGIYYFCNVGKDTVRGNLFYPFPTDSIYGHVDSVSVVCLSNSEPIEVIKNKEKGVFFKITVDPYSVKKYRVKYKQKLLSNKAEYILVTTHSWNKPMEVANYKLIVSDSIEVDSLSYKEDSTYYENNRKIYCWKKKDFMPESNMVYIFNKKK